MIVAMQELATDEQIQDVVEHLVRMGFSVHRTTGERQTILAAVGARTDFDTRNLEVLADLDLGSGAEIDAALDRVGLGPRAQARVGAGGCTNIIPASPLSRAAL